jgi:hypothetical protein
MPILTMEVTRAPVHDGWDELGGPTAQGEDFLLLVDDVVIGGTYWCEADYVADGQRWASYGPAGLSMGHPSREVAEHVQVAVYATEPDLYDRLIREEEAERVDAAARLEDERRLRDAERRQQRLGADEPGPTIWTVPAYHYLYADLDDVDRVNQWLVTHGLHGVDGLQPIRVEQRADRWVIVAEVLTGNGRATQTTVVTLTTRPPNVAAVARPDLHDLLDEHYPTRFPLIDSAQNIGCAKCTRETADHTVMPWHCPIVSAAIHGNQGQFVDV